MLGITRISCCFFVCLLEARTGADLDGLAELEHTAQHGAAGDATLEVLDIVTGEVDVEGADDHEAGRGSEVADGLRDLGADVLAHDLDVVAKKPK